MKKLFLMVAFLATSLFILSSCSKDDDDNGSIGGKVQYKLIGSSNVTLSTIQITDGNGQISSVAAPSGNTWTSDEITLNKKDITLQLGAGGTVSSGTGE